MPAEYQKANLLQRIAQKISEAQWGTCCPGHFAASFRHLGPPPGMHQYGLMQIILDHGQRQTTVWRCVGCEYLPWQGYLERVEDNVGSSDPPWYNLNAWHSLTVLLVPAFTLLMMVTSRLEAWIKSRLTNSSACVLKTFQIGSGLANSASLLPCYKKRHCETEDIPKVCGSVRALLAHIGKKTVLRSGLRIGLHLIHCFQLLQGNTWRSRAFREDRLVMMMGSCGEEVTVHHTVSIPKHAEKIWENCRLVDTGTHSFPRWYDLHQRSGTGYFWWLCLSLSALGEYIMQNTCPSFSCCAPPAQWSRNQVSWPESRHKSHHWTGPIQVLHSNFIWSTPSAFVFGSFLSHALHGEFCWQVNQDEKVKDIWTILHAREMCGCLDQTWENPSKGDGWENADVAQCCRDPQGSDWHKMTGSRNFKDTCCCHPYYPLHLYIYTYIRVCVCAIHGSSAIFSEEA